MGWRPPADELVPIRACLKISKDFLEKRIEISDDDAKKIINACSATVTTPAFSEESDSVSDDAENPAVDERKRISFEIGKFCMNNTYKIPVVIEILEFLVRTIEIRLPERLECQARDAVRRHIGGVHLRKRAERLPLPPALIHLFIFALLTY